MTRRRGKQVEGKRELKRRRQRRELRDPVIGYFAVRGTNTVCDGDGCIIAGSLEKIKKWTDTIRSSSEKIDDEVRLTRKSLLKQIEVLTQKMDALKEMLGADDGSN